MTDEQRLELHNSLLDDGDYMFSVEYWDTNGMQKALRDRGYSSTLDDANKQIEIGQNNL